MDFRWFTVGNLWSICSALANQDQAEAILTLIDEKWEDLIGTMPLKITFPALAEDEWRIITGADPKNTYLSIPTQFVYRLCCYDIECYGCFQ